VARELSYFADAAIDAAYRFCEAELRLEYGVPVAEANEDDGVVTATPMTPTFAPPVGPGSAAPSFVVLAMGKLGGEELNFSSDVDVMYFYSTDAGRVVPVGVGAAVTAGERTLHQFYGELSRRITQAIEEPTADGFLFRVDLRLRPEGRAGALCNSFIAAERYYETFGRTWERQALLRARPCAGDRASGDRLLQMLEPFIYPRHIAPGMIDEIRELRGMFRPRREEPAQGFDVKLGSGGIRDVELVVQTLQLLHAGKRVDLRGQSTPRGLRRLEVAGLLKDREGRTLSAAYRFLRQVEHRLQLQDGAQTHRVPGDREERTTLALRLHFSDVAAFDAQVEAIRQEVKQIAATFDDAETSLPPAAQRLLAPLLSRDELEAGLREAGFKDVESSADTLELLHGRLSPELFGQTLASPDPDRALACFRDLTLRASVSLHAQLREDPRLQRMLASLFGVSERLSSVLLRHPRMWEALIDGLGEPIRTAAVMAEALARRLDRLRAGGGDQGATEVAPELATNEGSAQIVDPDGVAEGEAGEMRRFQTEETLRIGLHDVAGDLATGVVARQLTDLAEALIEQSLSRLLPRLALRYGEARTSLTVLALGSLGAYEMRYGSDLDLVFLYGADGETTTGVDHRELFARVARRLINEFGAIMDDGRLYSVDTRLRPSGEQGLLVTSVAAFDRYHQEDAAGWERVALLRARVVFTTAPPSERAAFEARLEAITYHRPVAPVPFAADLRRIRARVDKERGKVRAGSRHLRFDAGGIMDVEFLAALGQLTLGARDRNLCSTETPVALAQLAAAHGWPSDLVTDYERLRRLAMRMRLLRDRPEDVIAPEDFPPLARSLDVDVDTLRAELDQSMRRIRAFFSERFPA
jgi:glutamate-ammonia-ligase adenylyltransferase